MDIDVTNAYAGPNHITANIQHGSWSTRKEPGKTPVQTFLNSNQQAVMDDLKYSKDDLMALEEWTKRHVETTWHSLGKPASINSDSLSSDTNLEQELVPWLRATATAL